MKIDREKLERYAPHLSALTVIVVILLNLAYASYATTLSLYSIILHHLYLLFFFGLPVWMLIAYLSFAIIRKKIFSRAALGSALGVFVGFLILASIVGLYTTKGSHPSLGRVLFILSITIPSIPLLSFYFGKLGMMKEEKKASTGKIWVLLALFSFLAYSALNSFFLFFIMGLFAYLYEYSLFQILDEKSEHFRRFNYMSFAIVFAISYVFWAPFFLWDISISFWFPLWLFLLFYSVASIIPFLVAFAVFALLHLRKRRFKNSRERMI